MSEFAVIVNQKKPVQLLKAFLQHGTIPSALLFTGMEGVGKSTAAKLFAMACNCLNVDAKNILKDNKRLETDQICSCSSCMKIRSGNHPDVIHVKPSGAYIKISQIRSLIDILAMKPYEAKKRVVIISNAHAMNPSAGNALLKMLEEPPDRTILILTAIQSSTLLPTIVSRCQHIRFSPISVKSMTSILIKEKGLDSNDAKIIAILAGGNLSKALSMVKSGNSISWKNRRQWLIKVLNRYTTGMLSTQPVGLFLGFAAELSRHRGFLQDSLAVIESWLRDVIVYKYSPEKIINQDLIEKIKDASEKLTVKEIIAKIEAVQKAQKGIKAGANTLLTLEVMVMRLI